MMCKSVLPSPKTDAKKCIGPVMHEQMPAYTVYIGKTGAFYMKKVENKGNQPAACTGAHHRRNDSCISRTEFCRKRGNRITGSCLMELTTGKILYEKEADTRRSPASVTKIMDHTADHGSNKEWEDHTSG